MTMTARAGKVVVLALISVAAMAIPSVAVANKAPAVALEAQATTAIADRSERSGLTRNPKLRIAQYNASLNRAAAGELIRDLSTPDNAQAQAIAEVIQRNRPDVILLNEFDYDERGEAIRLFQQNYLGVGQNEAAPIDFSYSFTAPVNTGIPSGYDLNNDGKVGGPDDAYGFGLFPGQYGMVILSKFPIDTTKVRTFQNFRWADMPGNVMPPGWYSSDAAARVRLSSKSHWDVPIRVPAGKHSRVVRMLAAHPTPPSFDGPEDRNGRRNHDEIRFWADYVSPGKGNYIYDDQGERGGLSPRDAFVIAGDYNADPQDGDSFDSAITQLLDNPRVIDPAPTSAGASEAARRQGGANLSHRGDPNTDTADFADGPGSPGNLRVDYVLPSTRARVLNSGVFWPAAADPLSRLTGQYPFPSSDHRLVWVDLRLR